MKKDIIINATINEVRVAIVENNKLAELFIETPDKKKTVGNIYLGKVNKIAESINAAFIDIGQKQDAFLHFSDIDESLEHFEASEKKSNKNIEKKIDENDKNHFTSDSEIALRKAKSLKQVTTHTKFNTKKSGNIKINLEPGQFIIVQVVREAYSTKGVRVSTKVGIPGRYVVFLPFNKILGISKKITSLEEKKRLKTLARNYLPKGMGCIIRTAAEGKSELELKKDWESLYEIWKEIEKKVKNATKPMLLYQDMPLAFSVIRDLFTKDVRFVFVDSKKIYKEIVSYLKQTSPHLVDKVQLYTGESSIFKHFGIENELKQLYNRKILLPSGGSIVIDQTEAMFVIDVNSGKSIQGIQQEKNAFKTNLEAGYEIARQIRLRDISGMILVDFIDLFDDKLKMKLYKFMKKELSKDRAKTTVYPLTQLGIMQITRQRISQNIFEKLSQTCPMCNGLGKIASKAVVLNSIEAWLKEFRSHSKEFRLILKVHPHTASFLTEGTISRLTKLMLKYFVKIKLLQDEHINIDKFQFFSVKRQTDITNEYLK